MSRAQQQFLLALPGKLLVTEFIRMQNVLDVPESLRQCLGVYCEHFLDVE